MNYQIRTEQFAGKPLAVVRRQATKPQLGTVIQQACGDVWNVVRAQHLKGGRHVAVYREHVDGVYQLEIGVELESPFAGQGQVVASVLPAGEVAVTTHYGPYQRLGEAHEAIHRWLKANAREAVRPCWELYGHWEDAWNKDSSLIRTDVYYLLK